MRLPFLVGALFVASCAPVVPGECSDIPIHSVDRGDVEPCRLAIGARGIVEAHIIDWGCPRWIPYSAGRFQGSTLEVEVTRTLKGSYSGSLELVAANGINPAGDSDYGKFVRGSSAYLMFYEDSGDATKVPPETLQILSSEGFYWGAGSGTVRNVARHQAGLPEADFIAQVEHTCPAAADAGLADGGL